MLLLVASFVQGQSVYESFLNETSSLYVQAKPFLLADKPLSFISFPVVKSRLHDELKRYLPDSTLQTLLKNGTTESVGQMWDGSLLNDVQLVHKDQIDTILGSVVVANQGESKRAYKKNMALIKSKRGIVYFFSHPAFDDERRFALLRVIIACGNGCGEHRFVLFKKEDTKWIKVGELYRMMS